MESLVGKKRVWQIKVPIEQLSDRIQFPLGSPNVRFRYKMVTFRRRIFEKNQKAACGLNADFGSASFLTRDKKMYAQKPRELELLTAISSNLVSGVFEITHMKLNVHPSAIQECRSMACYASSLNFTSTSYD